MKILSPYIFTLLLLIITQSISAQYIQVNDNYTAQQLVQALVGSSCAEVSNVTVSGSQDLFGGNSYGYFNAGTSNFPFSEGIILSTGYADSAPGPNDSLLSEGSTDWGGDADLEAALNVNNTINATVLEFDFIPYTNNISFDYIFSSEQYLTSINSPNQCNYTDGFAFLLKQAGSTAPYQNLAVVPGTDIPVKVNTVRGEGVCPAANEEYFDSFNGVNHPTNFNGQTVVLTAQATVTAGTMYHIKLVVADQGNNLYDSAIFLGGGSFDSTTLLGNDRLVATGNPLCDDETFVLDATTANAVGYQWYRNGVTLTNGNNATYNVTLPGEYSVEVQLTTSCLSQGSITIEYTAPPTATSATLLQCDDDNDGITVFNLQLADSLINGNNQNVSIAYYTSQNDADAGNNNIITNMTAYQNTVPNQTVYARVENQYGCHVVSTVILATSVNGLTTPDPIEECDNDGTEDGFYTFDLTQRTNEILEDLPDGLQLQYFTTVENAFSSINPISNPSAFTNTTVGGQSVYARIYSGSECYGITALELIVYGFGDEFEDETVILCDNSFVNLNAGSGYVSYSWDTDPEQNGQLITVTQPGTYTVTVENENGCEGTKTFTVVRSGRAVNAVITINDFSGSSNSITILAEGPGNYEYSIDGFTYQESPVFTGLASGEYTVYIKDRNGCGPVYRDNVFVLDYPKFFTPNGDSINDTWRIPYMTNRPDITVTIFNRYGKVITGFTGASAVGWDGTFNGQNLPADDYWFVIQTESGRKITGHFSLLR